jgi:hypothetical protein
MDVGKFNRLTLTERADLVWKQGEFVDSVICNNYCLMLYNVKDQFVELYLDLHSKNIIWISPANELDLEKYLSDIHIQV